jgi:1-acyl-sn-glycerol-3-phosphate acyltransferase
MFSPDLPPVSNRPLYAYRVFIKWLSFLVFGLSTLVLALVIFPPMRLVLRPRERFKRQGRRLVSFYMRGFVSFMHLFRIVDLETDNRENYRRLSSKIVVANHPSLLDIVILFSLIPNADCIVNAGLARSVAGGVIRQLYIPNSLDFAGLLRACGESLGQGNCLIIFPEGTRTRRGRRAVLKKGAARIALAAGCGVIPVRIGGTDKYGLGKKDPWAGFNPRERYVYRISMGAEISPDNYRSPSMPARARALARDIQARLFPPDETRA